MDEFIGTGMTENLAIRGLEYLVEMHAKITAGLSASPFNVKQVPESQWSLEALRLRRKHPDVRPGEMLRVEHGTPRREFARLVLALYRKRRLTERTLVSLVKERWRVAVITLEEDQRLSRVARSRAFCTPDARWDAAGIKFRAEGRRSLEVPVGPECTPAKVLKRPIRSREGRR